MAIERINTMDIKSLLVFGMTSTLTLGYWNFMADSAQARTFTLTQGYKGQICISGQSQNNVSINWGGWSYTFNPIQSRQEAAFSLRLPSGQVGDHPFVSGVKLAINRLSAADRQAARLYSSYHLELTSRGESSQFSISDNTATAKYGRCNFITQPFTIYK